MTSGAQLTRNVWVAAVAGSQNLVFRVFVFFFFFAVRSLNFDLCPLRLVSVPPPKKKKRKEKRKKKAMSGGSRPCQSAH